MRMTPLVSALLALASVFASTGAQAVTLADSVADFSGTQGQGGWYYGYYGTTFAPSAFQQMTQFNGPALPNSWAVNFTSYPPASGFWTLLDATGGHPDGVLSLGTVEQWAVRRWVSNVNGTVTVGGNIADTDGNGGNGIIGRIFLNSSSVLSQTIVNGDLTGVNYSFTTAVAVGDTIDFAIDPNARDELFDSTRFTATISAVPEPGSIMLFGAGLFGLAVRRRARGSQAGL